MVTDEMVQAGLEKWFESEGEEIAKMKADTIFWEIYQRDMRAAITAALEASGELKRLRAALNRIEGMDYINQLSGNANFERAQIIARTALQGDAL